MSKKTVKLPTQAELAFYRSKIETGSYIGTRQLASVFAKLDAETARADLAEQQLLALSTAAEEHLAMFEAVSEGIPWGKTVLSGATFARMNTAPIMLREALKTVKSIGMSNDEFQKIP